MMYLKITIISFFLVSVLACSTVNSNDKGFDPSKVVDVVDAGDRVAITTKQGGKYEFIIAEVTKERISGGGVSVDTREIESLSVIGPDGVIKTFRAIRRANSILFFVHLVGEIVN